MSSKPTFEEMEQRYIDVAFPNTIVLPLSEWKKMKENYREKTDAAKSEDYLRKRIGNKKVDDMKSKFKKGLEAMSK